jgi:hypothetical protein
MQKFLELDCFTFLGVTLEVNFAWIVEPNGLRPTTREIVHILDEDNRNLGTK